MSKVTVVGAGKYGSTTVQRLAEADIADEIVMTDIVEGLPQGLALDMNQSRPLERYRTRVVGTNDYADTAGSDVVVVTAGLPRKPGMSRMDLLDVNAKIVRNVVSSIAAGSPDAVLVVVTNPLDQMTTLAAEVAGFPRQRVMGQAGNLDTARFVHFIAEKTGADILEVEALTLGSHGETMVPVPSRCFVAGRPLTEVLSPVEIEELVQRTRDGGAEIVAYLKTGSAYYAPSSAAAKMVKAVLTDSGGLQEETTALGVPCVTIRENTERPITVEMGTNVLAGTTKAAIIDAYRHSLEKRGSARVPPLWDGMASDRIWEILLSG